MNYKTEILTGIRPTGGLTIANYIGAVKPILDLQKKGSSILVFVADIHAMTDNEPEDIKQYINEVITDYVALGINPKQTKIYLQSDLIEQVSTLTALLSRHISVSELLRVPTLKDKIRSNERPETANALLLLYPVLMAADILLNKAMKVPVGEDQLAHIEVARLLARRFNKKYGNTFPIPKVLQVKSLRIQSLKGEGKMSKTNPSGAIFLNDDLEKINRKIKSAETAIEGEMNDKLESHILIAKNLAKSKSEHDLIDSIIKDHKKGKRVMAEFKKTFNKIVQNFLNEFQRKRKEIAKDESFIPTILKEGNKIAHQNANKTIEEVKGALKIK